MSVDGKAAFDEWYEEHRNDPFNFQDELLRYCISDVDILLEGCLKFRAMFKEISVSDEWPEGIDPFASAITIASACNMLIRTHFLKPNTIGCIPTHGYSSKEPQSAQAKRWLTWIAHSKNLQIQHSRNGVEKKIGPYK